jgi:hypothetical protein
MVDTEHREKYRETSPGEKAFMSNGYLSGLAVTSVVKMLPVILRQLVCNVQTAARSSMSGA